MADTLAEQGYPHTSTDQWNNYMYPQEGTVQMYGNDYFTPLTRRQKADGTWEQKGMDGQWHPYVEFNVQKDANGNPITDANGNWQFNEGMSDTPSDADDVNKQFMTVKSPGTPQPTEKSSHKFTWKPWLYPLPQDNYFGREPTANYKEDIANNYDKSSANQQMLAQRAWQKANEDPYNKANRIAQSEANQKFTESQNQLNGSDNTSLVGRQLVEKDPTEYERWGQEQAYKAGEYQNAAINDANSAVNWRKTGAEDQYRYRQKGIHNATSDWLTMGPKEEDTKTEGFKLPPQEQQTPEPPQTESTWIDKVAMQDVLNCMVQKYWGQGVGKALNNDENQHVADWKEVARRPAKNGIGNHTFVDHPDYDTPEYHEAVEKAADMLWNGEAVKLDGKEYGGDGSKGVDAFLKVWEGRHGKEGYKHATGEDWENKNAPQKTSQNTAQPAPTQSGTMPQGFNFQATAQNTPPANIQGSGSDARFEPLIAQALGASFV